MVENIVYHIQCFCFSFNLAVQAPKHVTFLQLYSSLLWLSLHLMARFYKNSHLQMVAATHTLPAARSIQNWITFSLEWTETTSLGHSQAQVWLPCSHLLKEPLWGENTTVKLNKHCNWSTLFLCEPFSIAMFPTNEWECLRECIFRSVCP